MAAFLSNSVRQPTAQPQQVPLHLRVVVSGVQPVQDLPRGVRAVNGVADDLEDRPTAKALAVAEMLHALNGVEGDAVPMALDAVAQLLALLGGQFDWGGHFKLLCARCAGFFD